MSRPVTALGLALLYASAYFLPLLNPYALYFVPNFFDYVVSPSLICVSVLAPLFWLGASAPVAPGLKRAGLCLGAALLTFIAAKSLFDAAGMPWTSLLTRYNKGSAVERLEFDRWARPLVVGLAFPAAVWFVFLIRKKLAKWLHFLSTLGFAFVCLAMYRCLSGDLSVHPFEQAKAATTIQPQQIAPRRVVWVIFDEMDYRLSLGRAGSNLPNFARLNARAVSATQAYSPGRDTLYSVPALLNGMAVRGMEISHDQRLKLIGTDAASVPFDTVHSVFSRIPGGVRNASVLGFYHPYCRIFPLLRSCHSSYLGNAGRWYDGLFFFSEAVVSLSRFLQWPVHLSPDWLLTRFDPMYRVSAQTVVGLEPLLADKASVLDFIHINMPHLPNVYAQRQLHQPVNTAAEAYKQNLLYADGLLGQIVASLEAQRADQRILLVVSSDHWLRTASAWPMPVPFMAWEVGANAGQAQSIDRPLSTVHTASLAVDFLSGAISSQAEIAATLRRGTFSPTWMSPANTTYY